MIADARLVGELAGDLGGDLERLARDRDVAEQPEDAEVELPDAVAGFLADPADADVGPRLEGIQDRLPVLAQVEPDDVGLRAASRTTRSLVPPMRNGGCGRWTGFGCPSSASIV